MISSTRKCAACPPYLTRLALIALIGGCGGRTLGAASGEDDTTADGGTPSSDTPLPTCTEICNHVIDSCARGANIDSCKKDCETMRTDFARCKGELDAVLRCLPTAMVQCLPGEAKIVSCGIELGKLESCHR